MKVQVVRSTWTSPSRWDAAYESCPYAVFSQSRSWAEAWEAAEGGDLHPIALEVVFSDGLTALVPMVRRRLVGAIGWYYYSASAGTYGGWLAEQPLSPAQALALADNITATLPGLWWRLNPFDATAVVLRGRDAGGVDETQVLDLSGGLDALDASSARKHRKAVRKALRSGLSVRRADDLDSWRAYYDIYRASVERWGVNATSEYAWPLFEQLAKRSGDGVELWLASHGEGVIAGGINLVSATIVSAWSATGFREQYIMRPMDLMMHEMIVDAGSRGMSWFDLGPSAGLEGVRAFKESLGAQVLPAPVLRHERALVPYVRWVARRAGRVRMRIAGLTDAERQERPAA